MMDWKTLESAPLDGTPLLLYCPGINSWNRMAGLPEIVVGIWRPSASLWYSDIGDVDGYESTGFYFSHEPVFPTHWMLLPAPPRADTPEDPAERGAPGSNTGV